MASVNTIIFRQNYAYQKVEANLSGSTPDLIT